MAQITGYVSRFDRANALSKTLRLALLSGSSSLFLASASFAASCNSTTSGSTLTIYGTPGSNDSLTVSGTYNTPTIHVNDCSLTGGWFDVGTGVLTVNNQSQHVISGIHTYDMGANTVSIYGGQVGDGTVSQNVDGNNFTKVVILGRGGGGSNKQLSLDGGAIVTGDIYLEQLAYEINNGYGVKIYNATVNGNVGTGGGNDTITLDGGSASRSVVNGDIFGDGGNYRTGELNSTSSSWSWQDTITVRDGKVHNVYGDSGLNVLAHYDQTTGQYTADGDATDSRANDTIIIDGNSTVNGVYGEGGDDKISLQGSANLSVAEVWGDSPDSGDVGNDAVAWEMGKVTNKIVMGVGSDTLNVSSAFYTGAQLLDGGNGSVSDSGVDKLFIANAATSSSTGDLLKNWEAITLTSGSVLQLSGAPLTVGHGADPTTLGNRLGINIGAMGEAIQISGSFTINGDINSSGIVSMQNNHPGDTLYLNGDYNANPFNPHPQLLIDTDLGNDASPTDKLVVNGNVTGTTAIDVAVTGGSGAATVNGIPIVTVTGTSSADSFVLVRPAEIGAYTYQLKYDAGQYLLVNMSSTGSPGDDDYQINSVGAVYESGSSVALDDLISSMPTLEQRVGQRRWLSKERPERKLSLHREGFWMRSLANVNKITPRDSDAGLRYKNWSAGAQAGFDMLAYQSARGDFLVGLNGKMLDGRADVHNKIGRGHVRNQIYGGGLTTTWYGRNGFYVDSQNEIFYVRQKFSTDSAGTLKKGAGRMAFTMSKEVGYRYQLNETSALVPQAQFIWARLNKKHFTDRLGNELHYKKASEELLRLGMAYEYFSSDSRGHDFGDYKKAYIIGNVLHSFSKHHKVDMSDVGLEERNNRTWGEVGLGATMGWDEDKQLYTEASYRNKLGGKRGPNRGVKGTLGFKYSW